MGGESVRLWEYLIHHICIQIITEHSNESRKYTSFLKMGAYVNAVVRLRLQLQIRKNTYCSGPFFLHSTTASELCNICSIQILPALIYIKLWYILFLEGYSWCNSTSFFVALIAKLIICISLSILQPPCLLTFLSCLPETAFENSTVQHLHVLSEVGHSAVLTHWLHKALQSQGPSQRFTSFLSAGTIKAVCCSFTSRQSAPNQHLQQVMVWAEGFGEL